MYLVSAQTYVTERFEESDRGTAMGVYSMTGSIGSLVGPFVLGAVADFWGLQTVFLVTAGTVLVGIMLFLYMLKRPVPIQSYQT
jgi:MFS family permease